MTTSYDPQHDTPRTRREARDADVQDRPDLANGPRTRDDRLDSTDAEARQNHADLHDDTRDRTAAADRQQDVGVHPGTHDRVDTTGQQSRDLRDQPPVTAAQPPVTAAHETAVTHETTAAHATTPADLGLDPRTVVARERAEYGGTKLGSAFFGWLTATGTAVLLTALVAGVGVAVGLSTDTSAGQIVEQVSVAGAVSLIVILFVSYYCGGYVAGRMARFDGAKQGFAVWLWALVIAVIVAVVAAVAGDKYDVLARLNGFPRLPVNEGNLAVAGIVTALALVGASLVGAILGGLAGVRYHRKVDRVGLDPTNHPTTV